MKELKKWVKAIQGIWKQLTVLITWLGAIASTFILPLPAWGSAEEHSSQMHFTLFIATGIAGFIYLLTLKHKKKNTWLAISLISFLLAVTTFYFNDYLRELYTGIYATEVLVIGSEFTSEALERPASIRDLPVEKLLKIIAGDIGRVWTEESIYRNKLKLIAGHALTYCMVTIFIISITFTITLYATKENST